MLMQKLAANDMFHSLSGRHLLIQRFAVFVLCVYHSLNRVYISRPFQSVSVLEYFSKPHVYTACLQLETQENWFDYILVYTIFFSRATAAAAICTVVVIVHILCRSKCIANSNTLFFTLYSVKHISQCECRCVCICEYAALFILFLFPSHFWLNRRVTCIPKRQIYIISNKIQTDTHIHTYCVPNEMKKRVGERERVGVHSACGFVENHMIFNVSHLSLFSTFSMPWQESKKYRMMVKFEMEKREPKRKREGERAGQCVHVCINFRYGRVKSHSHTHTHGQLTKTVWSNETKQKSVRERDKGQERGRVGRERVKWMINSI